MKIEQKTQDGAAIFKPSGRIDQTTAENFQNALTSAMGGAKRMVIDMSGVDFITSVGLRSLMVAARKAKADGLALAISGLTPTVKEVFAISRFTTVIACHDDLETALTNLKS